MPPNPVHDQQACKTTNAMRDRIVVPFLRVNNAHHHCVVCFSYFSILSQRDAISIDNLNDISTAVTDGRTGRVRFLRGSRANTTSVAMCRAWYRQSSRSNRFSGRTSGGRGANKRYLPRSTWKTTPPPYPETMRNVAIRGDRDCVLNVR